MKQIPLTQGKFAIVDDEDFDELNKFKWFYHHEGYAVRSLPRPSRENVSMHRVIMNAPAGKQVDHINGNKLDDRRSNLRLCTHAENQQNRPARKDSSTGYKGVSKMRKKYQASIRVSRKLINLGTFSDPVDAAKAYDKGAKKYFGEFAYLNFPDEHE